MMKRFLIFILVIILSLGLVIGVVLSNNSEKDNDIKLSLKPENTIEEIQKLLGKEEKNMISKSISENAKETKYSYITKSLNSEYSNISETFSTYTQKDFVYDTNFFSQSLKTFQTLSFLSDGNKIFKPSVLNMFPYFKKTGSKS